MVGSPLVLGSDNKIYQATVSNSFNVDPTSGGQADWLNSASPQTLPANYVAGTTYASGNFVVSAGIIYQSLQNANTGNTPVSSPTFWLPFFPVPAAWDASTVYGTRVAVMGGNDHVFYTLQTVPAGLGDPNSFSNNNNPYWSTAGAVWGPLIVSSGLGLDFNGDIYMNVSAVGYTTVKIDGNTLKVKGNMTPALGLSVPTPSNGIIPLRVLNNDMKAEADYVVLTSNTDPAGTTHPSATIMSANSLIATQTNTFVFDEGNYPIACAGNVGVGNGQAFVLTRPIAGGATTLPVGLYEISVFSQQPASSKFKQRPTYWQDANKGIYGNQQPGGNSLRKAGTLSPSAVDPLWTFFTGFTGLMFDPQDGNVMTFVGTQNPSNYNAATVYAVGAGILNYVVGTDNKVYKALAAGTLPTPVGNPGSWQLIGPQAVQQNYMVKLSTDCARVLWAVPVYGAPTNDLAFQFVNISNGSYVFLEPLGGSDGQVRRINTLTGTATIQFPTQKGMPQLGSSQTYNDTTGDVVIYPQYDVTQVWADQSARAAQSGCRRPDACQLYGVGHLECAGKSKPEGARRCGLHLHQPGSTPAPCSAC